MKRLRIVFLILIVLRVSLRHPRRVRFVVWL
jgi:hypothetical protein